MSCASTEFIFSFIGLLENILVVFLLTYLKLSSNSPYCKVIQKFVYHHRFSIFAAYITSLDSRLFSLNFNKEDLFALKETHQSLSVPHWLSKHLTQPQKKFQGKCHLPEIPNFN